MSLETSTSGKYLHFLWWPCRHTIDSHTNQDCVICEMNQIKAERDRLRQALIDEGICPQCGEYLKTKYTGGEPVGHQCSNCKWNDL